MRGRLRSVAGLVAALAVWPAQAQQAATPEVTRPGQAPPPPQGRELNGHLFIPSELLVQPFIETDFRSVTGAGVLRSEGPGISLTGEREPTRREFTQLGYSQRFELQVKVLPWLAARGHATALVYSGINGRSIINLGSTVQYAAGGGLTAGTRFGPVQVALIADAAYEPTYSIDIGGTLGASIRARQVDTDPLVLRARAVPVRVGASLAFAPLAPLGIQVMTRYEHTFRDRLDLIRTDAVVAAAAVDFDFKALSPVPVGLLAAYQVAVPFGDDDRTDLWHSLNGGIFYTGRRNLALGMEASFRKFPQGPNVDSEAVVGSVVVRYYW
jgi:hypothetical protein